MELEHGKGSFCFPLTAPPGPLTLLTGFGTLSQMSTISRLGAEEYCSCYMYQKSMEFEAGPKWCSEPLRIESESMGDCGYESAITIFNMSLVDIFRGQLARAEKLLEMALSLAPCDNHTVIGPILNNMGKIYYENGEFADAADAFTEAVTLGQEAVPALPLLSSVSDAETELQKTTPCLAKINMSDVNWETVELEEDRSITSCETSEDSSSSLFTDLNLQQVALHELLAVSYANKALVHRRYGELEHCHQALTELLALNRKMHLPHSPQVMVAVYNVGVVKHQMELYAESRMHYVFFGDWASHTFGLRSLHRATVLHDVGNLEFDCRKLHLAMRYLLEACAIKENILGPGNHVDVSHILYSIGRLLHDREDFEDAAHIYERTLAMQQIVLGPTHACVVRTLCNLGRVHHIRGNLEGALKASQRVVELARNQPGNECFLASTLNLVGNIFLEMGETTRAMASFEESRTAFPAGAQILPTFVSPLHYSGFKRSDGAAPLA
jgi:tetratricopeptide (TPR) repeat protein